MNYFISAIGTDSGKTLFSAIIAEALNADYWKPIQAGRPTDTAVIAELVSNPSTKIHPEGFLLNTPASPHAAAKIDDIEIKIADILLPQSYNDLIIEGAGGLLVPINQKEYIVDLPRVLGIPIILVANLYLGSINHTLLSIEYLKSKNIAVKGIVFNGPSNFESEQIILEKSQYKVLLRIPELKVVNKGVVRELAKELLINWNE